MAKKKTTTPPEPKVTLAQMEATIVRLEARVIQLEAAILRSHEVLNNSISWQSVRVALDELAATRGNTP